jgi:hypothetical protein
MDRAADYNGRTLIGGLPSDLPGTVSEGMAFFAPLRIGEK